MLIAMGKIWDAVACPYWHGRKGSCRPREGRGLYWINILSFVLFKSYRNVTLLVQWIKMRWVRGEALRVLTGQELQNVPRGSMGTGK